MRNILLGTSMGARLPLLACVLALVALFSAQAAQTQESATPVTAAQAAEIAAIRALLGETQPGMVVGDISPSPVSGLYEVAIQNGQTIYVSGDARYLIPGDLYESTPAGLVNLGDSRRTALRREKIAALDEEDMIVFEAKGERKAVLTVFTDVDCPYCRKMHEEIDALNGYGITVRYLAFPRKGLDDVAYTTMASAWCSSDRKAMFTSATRGGAIPETRCDNPVAEQYQLGREVGVTGTPALVLEDGTIMPGYVPAETLASYLVYGNTP